MDILTLLLKTAAYNAQLPMLLEEAFPDYRDCARKEVRKFLAPERIA